MPLSLRRRLTAALAAVALPLSGLLMVTAAPAVANETWGPVINQHAARTASCTDVLFIGARGSGESPTDHEGYGSTVQHVRDGFKAATAGKRTVTQVALDYPAEAISGTNGSLRSGLEDIFERTWTFQELVQPDYFAGVDTGATEVILLLNHQRTRCPSQQVVLAGYSQGAWVMHLVLARRAPHHGNLIAGAALVADPGRNPLDGMVGTTVGTPTHGLGVGTVVSKAVRESILPAGVNLPISARHSARIIDVCSAGDPVCDSWSYQIEPGISVGAAADWSYVIARLLTMDVHTSYGKPGAFIGEATLQNVGRALDARLVKEFTDVPKSNQFFAEINWLAVHEYTNGYADGTFRPLQAMARDAMAAFLYRLAGAPAYTPPQTPIFADVPRSNVFYKEISWLAEQGITTGWTVDGGRREFRPLNLITRDAMAAFLYRHAGSPNFTPRPEAVFADVPPGAQFHREISWMATKGLSTGWTQGDGTFVFRPLTFVNRDAMAAFLYRFMNH